jgi:uncharacterized protein (DUF2236 family)
MRPNGFIIRLPLYLQRRLESAANVAFASYTWRASHFTGPIGEPALLSSNSVSWRIFKNPIALLIGGVAAVILELAEPAVRTGVWEFSSFSKDPMGRLRRTGSAAMVTVYSACSVSEPMIAAVVRMHAKVTGQTPAGRAYSANDEQLLSWVQATATFGIAEAYSRYVSRLSPAEFDSVYREGASASRLYGALSAPTCCVELRSFFDSMRGQLEPSPAIFEFLKIMREIPVTPGPLRWMQPILVRAAVEIIPDWVRKCLGLTEFYGLFPLGESAVRLLGTISNSIVLAESPAALSCRRLGIPISHLYV